MSTEADLSQYEEAVFINTIEGWIRLSYLKELEFTILKRIEQIKARGMNANQEILKQFEESLEDVRNKLKLRVYYVNFNPESPLLLVVLEELDQEDKDRYYIQGMMYG